MKFNRKLNLKKKNDAFVSHFRFLGLSKGECRTNVIRSAAQAMSVALSFPGDRVADDHQQQSADDVRRAKIAVAAYRLLDPRERTDVYERVQLCYPIDRDDAEAYWPAISKLVDQMPKVPVRVRGQTGKSIQLMGQALIEVAIDGNAPSDDEPGAESREDLVNRSNSELSLEERRGVVRLMRKSDESILSGLFPIGWLRSRLGI